MTRVLRKPSEFFGFESVQQCGFPLHGFRRIESAKLAASKTRSVDRAGFIMVNENPEREREQGGESLMTYSQVAAELHVKRGTLWFWVSQGLIPHVRLAPRTVRFRREDLRRWLEQRAIKASSGP